MSSQIERMRSIRVKLERAEKHLKDLSIEVSSFMQRKPYTVGVRTERGETLYYLAKVTDTPNVLSAITGDVLFNLRAALDHLVYSLAEINQASQTTLKSISFPIFDDSAKYQAGAPGKLNGLSQHAIDAINATEPYNGGKGYRLWQLHRLNNIDKHRLVITVGCQLIGFRLHTTRRRLMHKAIHAEAGINLTDAQADAFNPMIPSGNRVVLKKGAVLVRDLFANEESDQSEKFIFDVALDEATIIDCEPLVPTLTEMADHVEGVINNLGPLFL